jgi:NAD(P)-dependent dehydrogenase (short-subunit alcohol dehydrogenase family)
MNLVGVYRLTRACFDKLKASRIPAGGSVVIVSSETAFLANELVPGYGAAKGGLLQMTRTLGAAWGRQGVRVNTVGPGLTESGMTTGMTDADTQPYRDRTPLGRIGRPTDVAGAVLFLSSSAACFITGQMLPIEGGHSIVG